MRVVNNILIKMHVDRGTYSTSRNNVINQNKWFRVQPGELLVHCETSGRCCSAKDGCHFQQYSKLNSRFINGIFLKEADPFSDSSAVRRTRKSAHDRLSKRRLLHLLLFAHFAEFVAQRVAQVAAWNSKASIKFSNHSGRDEVGHCRRFKERQENHSTSRSSRQKETCW